MKDEIKEILDSKVSYVFTYKDRNELLDYITNLQERKITKEDVNKYFEENMCVSFDKFIENWNEQEELTNYYKQRNEKAIEFIEHENFKRNILVGVSTKKYTRDILNNVFNILKGDKDE